MPLNIKKDEVVVSETTSSIVPAGSYRCVVDSAIDEPDCRSAAGNKYSRVRLRFQIVEGPYENRILFKDCIYEHPNETAANIGLEFLLNLHEAAGCEGEDITPESLLTGGTFLAQVKVTKSEAYGDRSEVRGVKSYNAVGSNGKSSAPPREVPAW